MMSIAWASLFTIEVAELGPQANPLLFTGSRLQFGSATAAMPANSASLCTAISA
jgi:hypothetical protein